MSLNEAPSDAVESARASAFDGTRQGAAAVQRALCVSIHDVAPSTWKRCQILIEAISTVAEIPLTLLVVPQYHGQSACPPAYRRDLDRLLLAGHELALHGYTHCDEAAPPSTWRARFQRTRYTQGEGEFAALDERQARAKLQQGLAWFASQGWPVCGFVAPAWLLGPQSWRALRQAPFAYTTTMRHFYSLHADGQRMFAPSLVYAARNCAGRTISPLLCSGLAALLRQAPLLRLSLHPRDADHPALLAHAQGLLARLLATREPMTKAGFLKHWQTSYSMPST